MAPWRWGADSSAGKSSRWHFVISSGSWVACLLFPPSGWSSFFVALSGWSRVLKILFAFGFSLLLPHFEARLQYPNPVAVVFILSWKCSATVRLTLTRDYLNELFLLSQKWACSSPFTLVCYGIGIASWITHLRLMPNSHLQVFKVQFFDG